MKQLRKVQAIIINQIAEEEGTLLHFCKKRHIRIEKITKSINNKTSEEIQCA